MFGTLVFVIQSSLLLYKCVIFPYGKDKQRSSQRKPEKRHVSSQISKPRVCRVLQTCRVGSSRVLRLKHTGALCTLSAQPASLSWLSWKRPPSCSQVDMYPHLLWLPRQVRVQV